jgi:phenylalanyl-tRNA synthetase beta subunit
MPQRYYEKGSDPNVTVLAAKRAAALIKRLAGGEISDRDDRCLSIMKYLPAEVRGCTIKMFRT